jgi:hypothetical protein
MTWSMLPSPTIMGADRYGARNKLGIKLGDTFTDDIAVKRGGVVAAEYQRSYCFCRPSICRRAAANASLIEPNTSSWPRSSEGWWLTTTFSWGGIVSQMLMR